MRHTEGALSFRPRLPAGLTRLAFGLLVAGRTLRVEVTRASATYSIGDGEALHIVHHDRSVTVSAVEPVTCPYRIRRLASGRLNQSDEPPHRTIRPGCDCRRQALCAVG